MGWFDDQLKYRQEKDDQAFSDATADIAGAVMGRRMTAALDNKESARNAVQAIFRYYHLKLKDEALAESTGSAEEQLDCLTRPLGVMRRNVKLDNAFYRNTTGPMLGVLKENNLPVALLPSLWGGYTYQDPVTGKRVRVNRKTRPLLTDDAVYFYQPLPQKPLSIRDLLVFAFRQLPMRDIVSLLGIMALMAALGLLSPMFVRLLFGDIVASGSVVALIGIACFMGCASLARTLLSVYQNAVQDTIQTRQHIAVQAAVMARVFSLPTQFFRQYSSGELSRRTSYVSSLCNLLLNGVVFTALNTLSTLVYLGQISSFAPSLVWASILVLLASTVTSVLAALLGIRYSRDQMLQSAKTGGMTYSMITGIQKIRVTGAEKRFFARWGKQYAKEAALTYHPPLFLRLSATINLAISLTGTLLIYSVAIRNQLSVADYYAFSAAYGVMSAAFSAISNVASNLANIKPTLEMAQPILQAQPEISEEREIVRELRGGIEMSHISFRYQDDTPDVIDDLSLKIRPGEYVALTGPTGCGKSTLIRLLLGFETARKGNIMFDRMDINRMDLKSLRQHIGSVMQDSQLFPGEILENITISTPELSLEGAWKAAELASVAEDIRQMPMGMNTLVSEGSGGISGGQRQRLMIARALAGEPKILIFDEATSALDNVTQKAVSDAIDSLHCTRLVIAHRLSTIRHCDRILVMDKGRIVEEGTYDELIAQNGFFAALVERQRLD